MSCYVDLDQFLCAKIGFYLENHTYQKKQHLESKLQKHISTKHIDKIKKKTLTPDQGCHMVHFPSGNPAPDTGFVDPLVKRREEDSGQRRHGQVAAAPAVAVTASHLAETTMRAANRTTPLRHLFLTP
jgi:hypothetical protein